MNKFDVVSLARLSVTLPCDSANAHVHVLTHVLHDSVCKLTICKSRLVSDTFTHKEDVLIDEVVDWSL
jgi:hypothetical protein